MFENLPDGIKNHLTALVRTAGLDDSEETLEALASAWTEKLNSFQAETSMLGMEEIDRIEKDDPQGVLAMTYSGSLLNIGPELDGSRKVQYASIGLRKDVPETAEKGSSILASDVELDEKVVFSTGPIKSSSPVFKIAIVKGVTDPKKQVETIDQATQILTEDFVEANKTVIIE